MMALGRKKYLQTSDNNFIAAEMMQLLFERVENIVGKEENVGLAFFQMASIPESSKVSTVS